MTSWAKPGTKVICLDAYWEGEPSPLKHGRIYTIRRILNSESTVGKYRGLQVALDLYESINPSKAIGFSIGRFRPLITQQDDVELFRHLLSPSPLERLDLLAERLDEIYNVDAG